MTCGDHQEWLQTYLDGEATTDAPAVEHRSACAGCREQFAAARCMLAALRTVAQPAPPAGLGEQLVRAVAADRRRSLRYRRGAAVAALAATVLLATLHALPWPRPAAENGAGLVAVAPETTPSLEENLQEATGAVVSLTRRATEETMDQTRLLLPAFAPEVPLSDTPAHVALSTPAQPLREVQETVAEGLAPVTDSWRRAVDLFRRNLPPMTSAE